MFLTQRFGFIEQKSEMALIDAKKGHSAPPVLPDGVEHRAIAADNENAVRVFCIFEMAIRLRQRDRLRVAGISNNEQPRMFEPPSRAARWDATTIESIAFDVSCDFGCDQAFVRLALEKFL